MRHPILPAKPAVPVILLFLLYVSPLSAQSADPELIFSTFLGGSQFEQIRDITTDADGNVYVTGGTASPDFPTTEGAFDRTLATGGTSLGSGGPMDVFITKFSPTGELLWSTLLGGPNYDRAYAIEVDRDGYVFVGGRAGDQFPTTFGTVQPEFAGDNNRNGLYGAQDGFITKLLPDGSGVVWSTYFGHVGMGFLRDIDIDEEGNVYAAMTGSPDGNPHVTAGSFRTVHGGGRDLVIAKISADGARVLWGGYLGGSGDVEAGPSVRAHTDGSVYVTAGTNSRDLPTTPGAFNEQYNGGDHDLLVARISADGSRLLYCTYLGGSDNEALETHNLAVDREGNAYLSSGTQSKDFPTTAGAYQRTHGASANTIFVSKLSPDGRRLLASTLYGGSVGEFVQGIYVNDRLEVTVGGTTRSPDFPVTFTSPRADTGSLPDIVFVTLSPDFSRPLHATRFGGGKLDDGRTLIADERGGIYVAGQTESPDYPVFNAAFDRYAGRGSFDDAVVAAFRIPQDPTGIDATDTGIPQDLRVRIAPHPVRDRVVLTVNTGAPGLVSVTIHDLLGRRMWDAAAQVDGSRTWSVPAGHLRPGVYGYMVQSTGARTSGLILVE